MNFFDIYFPATEASVLKVCWDKVGPIQTNCYLVWDPQTRSAVLVDPGAPSQEMTEYFKQNQLVLKTIVNTHGHADHLGGNAMWKKTTGAKLGIHAADQPMLSSPEANLSLEIGMPIASPGADFLLDASTTLQLGHAVFHVLETPGHTPGSVCLWVGDALFSGDTLFAGTAGRTDLVGGNYLTLLHSLHYLKSQLPPYLKVYPGHGEFSTLDQEVRNNPFFQAVL